MYIYENENWPKFSWEHAKVDNLLIAARGESQGSFDFLNFTFYLGRSRVISKVKTSGKTFRAKLNNVTSWCKTMRNRMTLGNFWKIYQAKIRGHVQYYGVSHNTDKVGEFIGRATKIL